MKALVFDSSAIISLSENCLIKVLGHLAENYKGKFYITGGVERETVYTPLKIKRFELSALRIEDAIERGWIKVFREEKKIGSLTQEILQTANNCFFSGGAPLRLIHFGEAESLALFKLIEAEMLLIDERTTRLVFENPMGLRRFISQRYNKKVRFDKGALNRLNELFGEPAIARSTELMALAFDKGLFGEELVHSREALRAALYALKFGGCAVSSSEIESYLKGIK